MGDLSAMSSIERVLEHHEDEIMEDWASLVPKSLAGVFRKVILSNGTRCIPGGMGIQRRRNTARPLH